MKPAIVTLFLLAATAAAAMDPSAEILARWPNADNVTLLREAGVTIAVGPPTEAFARACQSAGLTPFAELPAAARAAASQARNAGFRGLVVEAAGDLADEKALQAFIAGNKDLDLLVYLTPRQIAWQVAPAHAVLRYGLWPGVRSGPNVVGRGIEVATASREPWVDANFYLVAYLQGLFPKRAALLGYRPDRDAGLTGGRAVPYETLELALAEAVAAGGNFILTVEDDYRAALLKGDPKAAAAWRSLGETIRFLRRHAEQFRRPSRSQLAVAAGSLAESGEVLNLMFRRNLFPVVLPAASVPPVDPARFRAVVAANIAPPTGLNLDRLLAYGRAGGLLITADKQPWWLAPDAKKIRSDIDRDFYSLGKGHVLAYRAPIADPSEFAFDVIDAVGVRTRDLRLWNASSVAGLASRGAGESKALLYLINYGEPVEDAFPARIEGIFQRAVLQEPGGATPRQLQAAKRGSATEITVDRLGRFGLIVLE